jgi:hypothetical protein
MQYLLLVCHDDTFDPPATLPTDGMVWATEMGDRGVRLTGSRLRPANDATTVRRRDGELLVTDGPFIETKEVLGGYSVIDADTIDEAVEIAKTWPGVDRGWITMEVRPVIEMG